MLGRPNNMWVISPENLALIPSDIQPTGGPGSTPGYPKLVTQYHLQNTNGTSMTRYVPGDGTAVYFHLSSNSPSFSSSNPYGVRYESTDYTFTDVASYNGITERHATLPVGHLFHASINMLWGYEDDGVDPPTTTSSLDFSIAHAYYDELDEGYVEVGKIDGNKSSLGPAGNTFSGLNIFSSSASGIFYSPESDLITEVYPINQIQVFAEGSLATANILVRGYNYTLLDLGLVGIISGAGFG